MRRRDVLRGAGLLGTGVVSGIRPVRAHEGGGSGGTVDDAEGNAFEPLGYVDVPGAMEVVVEADVAYLATGDGYAIVDLSNPAAPTVITRRTGLLSDVDGGPLQNVQDVKVDGDTLVVAAPAHPRPAALAGVLVVDVSDPTAPTNRGFFETDYPVHNCDVVDGRAYLTGNDGDRNALVVVDVRGDRGDEPTALGSWSLVDVDERWSSVRASRRTLHDVTVHDGVAVCAHWDAGTWLVDVSDPTSPTVLGSVEAPRPQDLSDDRAAAVLPPGNHHYSTLDETGTLLAVGKETFGVGVDDDGDGERDRIVGGPSGVDLWDVTDPAAPSKLSTIPPPTSADPTRAGTWTTAHNLDLSGGTLYTSWYRGGVKRHDVSDPTTPVEASWWLAPSETDFWTAQAVSGAFFVASSRDVDDVPGRLYTFPDHAGEQSNRPALGSTTPTETDVASETPHGRSPGSRISAPGFEAATGLTALGIAGWLAWRRRDR